MFRVHTPIIRSIRCWVAAYGFLHRVFGWVVVLQKTICCNSASNAPDDGRVPETCQAKNSSIKLPSCIRLAFHFISWGRCTVKQSSSIPNQVGSTAGQLLCHYSTFHALTSVWRKQAFVVYRLSLLTLLLPHYHCFKHWSLHCHH